MSRIPLPLAGAQQHRAPRIAGIDLGTTNSLIAVMRNGQVEVLGGPDGSFLLPSIVHYPPAGPPLVGEAARRKLPEAPERTVYSIKRLMGKSLADVEAERSLLPYTLSDEHPDVARVRIDGRVYTPSEVSACILRELKERAEAVLGEPIEQAVITVPAYFNDAQRQATRDAGRLAGLEVLRIVNEPTAACLAYGLDSIREATVAVYDLGGGTFDISILRLKEGIFDVRSTNGDTRLGGDDFDHVLAEHLLRQAGLDGTTDSRVRESARLEAERVKRILSDEETAEARIGSGLRITRAEFEALIGPIVERTLEPCRQALQDAEVSPDEIDEVVLVGGSTRVPLVRRRVEELFGRPPHRDLDPDMVVAVGAGIQAGILAGEVEGLLLLDVNPLSLGIETYGGSVEKLIARNSTIPAAARQMFTTAVEGQTAFDIHVVQGERELAADNRSLARFQIHLPPMPAGWPKLEVTFMVDENGILSVSAFEHRSQSEARIEVRPSYGLTEDEVERMVIESFEHAEEDLRVRRETEARVEAEQVILHTEKQLPLADAYVESGELSPAERSAIGESLAQLKSTLIGGSPDDIHAALQDLELASSRLAQLVMDRAVARLLQGRRLEEDPLQPAGQE